VLFNSLQFLIFFTIVFTVYWAVPVHKVRVILLLAASYYFYMSWNAKLAAVVAASSLVDFFIARSIAGSNVESRRKALVAASIVMNLGLLFYFKYANFFLDSLHTLLAGFGLHQSMPVLDVVLPIGISFYTFEAISYTVDVYTKRTEAERNPIHFLLFITFFPRMVAGPIIRARNFLPQLKREKRFSWARFDLGFQYVLMGLFKKMAIADRMAYLVDPVYKAPVQYSTGAVWVAVVAYSLQIYCDFSGYSDIAIGTAHMMGFKLPENFNMPYLARNIGEFWRRWHISLSTWLRDYVFIQLGGSRGTLSKTVFTLLATFALCGLWHGARWTFVAWGIAQGVMVVTHRTFHQYCKTRPGLQALLNSGGGIAFRVALTYLTVILGWVVFRAPSFSAMGVIFHAMFIPQRGIMVRDPLGPWSLVFAFAVTAIAHLVAQEGFWKTIRMRLTSPVWGMAYLLTIVMIGMLMPGTAKAFIYFQF